MTNSLTGLTEVSISQAAASLMGLKSMSTTTNTVFCFIKGAMRFQDTLVNNDDSSMVSYDLCDRDEDNLNELDNDNLSVHSHESMVSHYLCDSDEDNLSELDNDNLSVISHDVFQGSDANDNEQLNQDEFQMEDLSNMHQQQQLEQPVDNNNNMIDIIGLEGVTPAVTNTLIHGEIDALCEAAMPLVTDNNPTESEDFAILYTINGRKVPISPHTHYRYRGQSLCHLNFIEYSPIVMIVKQVQESTNEEPTMVTRPRNATFLFDPAHPAYEFYCQRLRSKQSTPILASVRPPPYPGDKPQPCTRIWIQAFHKFARYYLTAFCPWDTVTGKIPYSFDFQGYSAFVQHMANLPNFLNRARKQYLETTIRRLTIDHKKLVATTIYKSSNADRRVGNRFIRPNVNDYICTGHNNDTGTNEVETEINEQAIALLNKIQAEVRQDDNTNQISAGDQNAILVAAALTEVMESNEVLQQPDIYQDSTIEQPSEQCTILAFQ
jgi:hypothetical protein